MASIPRRRFLQSTLLGGAAALLRRGTDPALPLLLRGGQFGVLWAKTPGTAPMNGTASATAGRGRRALELVGTVPKTGTAPPDAGRGAPRWLACLARPPLGGLGGSWSPVASAVQGFQEGRTVVGVVVEVAVVVDRNLPEDMLSVFLVVFALVAAC
jgi:hypothetical protein